MKFLLADTFGNFFQPILEFVGIREKKSWDEIQSEIRSYRSMPVWASDTLVAVLGNMQETECVKAYSLIRRRLKSWGRISNDDWAKTKHDLISVLLRMTTQNLREILTPHQIQLPWINSLLETSEQVRSLIAKNGYIEAEKNIVGLKNFRADQAYLLNFELAEMLESTARAIIAAAEQDVASLAINSMKNSSVELKDHPIGKVISWIDYRV